LKEPVLSEFFHPFGHCVEAKVAGQRQDGANQSRRLGPAGDVSDENAVDLEGIDWDVGEQAQ
jgi:hypothetical protein